MLAPHDSNRIRPAKETPPEPPGSVTAVGTERLTGSPGSRAGLPGGERTGPAGPSGLVLFRQGAEPAEVHLARPGDRDRVHPDEVADRGDPEPREVSGGERLVDL